MGKLKKKIECRLLNKSCSGIAQITNVKNEWLSFKADSEASGHLFRVWRCFSFHTWGFLSSVSLMGCFRYLSYWEVVNTSTVIQNTKTGHQHASKECQVCGSMLRRVQLVYKEKNGCLNTKTGSLVKLAKSIRRSGASDFTGVKIPEKSPPVSQNWRRLGERWTVFKSHIEVQLPGPGWNENSTQVQNLFAYLPESLIIKTFLVLWWSPEVPPE